MSFNVEWTSADALTPKPFKKFTAYETVPVTYDTTTTEAEAWNRKTSRGERMLVEVSVPLEVIGRVECDYDGGYHVEVMGQEVATDEDTYWRVIRARESDRARELGIKVD